MCVPRPIQQALEFFNVHISTQLSLGVVILLLIGPPIGIVVGSTVLWEAADRGFKGGLVESNNELTGLIFGRLVPWFEGQAVSDITLALASLHDHDSKPLLSSLAGRAVQVKAFMMPPALCNTIHGLALSAAAGASGPKRAWRLLFFGVLPRAVATQRLRQRWRPED